MKIIDIVFFKLSSEKQMYPFCFGAEGGTSESSLLGRDPSPGGLVQQPVVVVQFLLQLVVDLKPMRGTGCK